MRYKFLVLFAFVLIISIAGVYAACEISLQLREHRYTTSYSPDVRFTKETVNNEAVLRARNYGGNRRGDFYAFYTFDKSFLNGKKIRVNWSTFYGADGGSCTDPTGPYFYVEVYDGDYDRKSMTDFPDGKTMTKKGNGALQEIERAYRNTQKHTVEKQVIIDNATLDKVTLFIRAHDAWIECYVGFYIYSLEILDENDNIIRKIDAPNENVVMEVNDSYNDYGLFGSDNFDNDGDGFADASCGGTDCDDSNPDIYPEATEICGNDIDENCDGVDAICPRACSSSQQIILRLSHKENAHAELWNGSGNYPLEICYDEIFGYAYSGENPHECKGNKVLGLSDETNAHAEVPSLDNYDIGVCYGKLICNSRDSCLVGEELIVSLSEETNAHLSNGSDYEFKICCKTGKKLLEAYWTNMRDEKTNESDLNDRVKMVAEGEGLEEVNFTLYKERAFWFDKKISSQSSTKGFITWVASERGSFYFTAESYGETKDSGNIEILSEENNSAPYAKILTPYRGEIYYMNAIINFTQESYDEDDFFNYTWNFGDDSKEEGSTEDYENYNTNHSYSITGQKNILLEIEDERKLRDEDRTSILIIDSDIDGKYVFADISKPEYGEEIYGNEAEFNANESYAVENNATTLDIICIAGDCPERVTNGDVITGTPNWQGFENLEFNWSFDDNSKRSKKGSEGAEFTKRFSMPGNHYAELKVSIDQSSSETYVNFSLSFSSPYCLVQEDTEERTVWFFEGKGTDSFNDCYRQDGEPTSYCCPSGYSCIENDNWKCKFSEKYECFDYKAEGECENFNAGVAIKDIETKTEERCGSSQYVGYDVERGCDKYKFIENCRCFWNSTSEKCQSAWNLTEICKTEGEEKGTCFFDVIEATNCTNGWRRVGWEAFWKGSEEKPEYCNSDEKQIACISEIPLNFFDSINFIIAVLLIIIFYIIVVRKKRKYKKRKK